MMIEIYVSEKDMKKLENLDEFNLITSVLQTSGAEYIKFHIQPERTNPEDALKSVCDVPIPDNK